MIRDEFEDVSTDLIRQGIYTTVLLVNVLGWSVITGMDDRSDDPLAESCIVTIPPDRLTP